MYQQYEIRFPSNCYFICRVQYIRDNYVNFTAILILLAVNCVVDYCANIVTVSLIELAAQGL